MKMMTMDPAKYDSTFLEELKKITSFSSYNPHHILGLHSLNGNKVIRLWRPDADKIYLEVFGQGVEASKITSEGLFEYVVPSHTTPEDYRIYHKDSLLAHDPYAFLPTFGEVDQYLFAQGVHYKLYEKMGGRLITHQGIRGASFVVWAPNAKSVSLVGDFNFWDGRINPMRVLGFSGVWELFIPGIQEGCKYKFEIHTQKNELLLKIDPYATCFEMRPSNASKLANINNFTWHDQDWMSQRKEKMSNPHPMNIYELHLGSWRKKHHYYFYNYREIAEELAQYCKEMGYTHIELMPIQEHPLDESWGYQVTGFYAPTSRYGSPEDFQYFVNHLHQNNIGVILDWVPAHFPTDDFSLGKFDGSSVYEHDDPRQGFHPHWSTYIFNYGRHEVSNFLIANALYWFEAMHIDGLRVDAVASMLYLDYGRNDNEWIPNEFGGKENIQAIEFLKHLNAIVHDRCPGIQMIAEESTSFLGISHPLHSGGMGFDLKWNMGWMNDTLRYFSKDSLYRSHHHNDLTFGLIYAFSERFALVLSHDEVVHGKKALISKMPGDPWQQFANLRLLITYMMCQPGKKLLFMGGEIAQWNEWNCKSEIEWFLLNFPTHQGIHNLVKEINHFYLVNHALWEREFHHETFQWIDFLDNKNSVISYLRKSAHETLLCVHNFTPATHQQYVLHFGDIQSVQEVFNSDKERYGGSGIVNNSPEILHNEHGQSVGIRIIIAPLATMIFKIN